jgi:hypothetical protein
MIVIIDKKILVSAAICGSKLESLINWIINRADY